MISVIVGLSSSAPGWSESADRSDVLQDTVAGHGSEPGRGTAERPLNRGDQFGRYVLLDRVGRGACGVVYAAYDARLDRRVALKIIDRVVSEEHGETLKMQSVREAQALAKLSHPNIVTVHDVDEHDGRLFIAMEFIEGQTLGQWCADEPRPWRDVLEVLLGAGRGVMAVHEADLVHRDIKPGNVMVEHRSSATGTGAWRARVMDFGLARRAGGRGSEYLADRGTAERDEESTWASSGGVVGTPAYMAPEQHLGLDAGPAADQFSFCVAAYEALYGCRPFRASTLPALAAAVTEGAVEEPPRGCEVPEHVWQALRRGLRPVAEERWPSMVDLLGALERAPASSRAPKLAAGSIAVIGVVAASGWALWPSDQTDPCEDATAPMQAIWSPEARKSMQRNLRSALRSDRANPIVERVDRFAAAWHERAQRACRTAQTTDADQSQLRLVQSCLDLRRAELQAWLDVLVGPESTQTVVAADAFEQALSDPGICDDIDALQRNDPAEVAADAMKQVQPLRERLTQAGVYLHAGRFREALARYDDAVAMAQEADIQALLADALRGRGLTRIRRQEFERARGDLTEAYRLAVAHRRDHTALEASYRMAFLLGETGAPVDAIDAWAQHAVAMAERVEDDVIATNVYEVLATAHAEADPDQSRVYFQRALEAAERAHGPDSRDVGVILLNSGVAAMRRNDATAVDFLDRAIRIIADHDGPDTVLAQHARRERAAALAQNGDFEAALALGRENLVSIERTVGTPSQLYGLQLSLLAEVSCSAGHFEACRDYADEALIDYESSVGSHNPMLLGPLTSLTEASLELRDRPATLQAAQRGQALAAELKLESEAEHFEQLRALAEQLSEDGESAR